MASLADNFKRDERVILVLFIVYAPQIVHGWGRCLRRESIYEKACSSPAVLHIMVYALTAVRDRYSVALLSSE